jgi:hypothetical protein
MSAAPFLTCSSGLGLQEMLTFMPLAGVISPKIFVLFRIFWYAGSDASPVPGMSAAVPKNSLPAAIASSFR